MLSDCGCSVSGFVRRSRDVGLLTSNEMGTTHEIDDMRIHDTECFQVCSSTRSNRQHGRNNSFFVTLHKDIFTSIRSMVERL